MSALGYWVGAVSTLACAAIAAWLRLYDVLVWQRATARNAKDGGP